MDEFVVVFLHWKLGRVLGRTTGLWRYTKLSASPIYPGLLYISVWTTYEREHSELVMDVNILPAEMYLTLSAIRLGIIMSITGIVILPRYLR